MSTLIVVRIIPQAVVAPGDFTSDYLNPSLGPLQISAFELSFSSPTAGQLLGTASFVPVKTSPSPTTSIDSPPAPFPSFKSPKYSGTPTQGIVQRYDLAASDPPHTAFFELESVATAIIEVPSGTTVQNIRLTAQWGSGAGATPIPINLDFYGVATSPGPAPGLNTWTPTTSATNQIPRQSDPWASLTPSAYIHLPAPPTSSSFFSFALPADGTPPPFDDLLKAVNHVLSTDPGGAVKLSTSGVTPLGSAILKFTAPTGITVGMNAQAAGIPPGATVIHIDSTTGEVTLSEEVTVGIGTGVSISFTPNLGALSQEQCRNIAYEIIWSQQPPLPNPADLGEFYSDPPNSGSMLSGGSGAPLPNQLEADRQQFEAQLSAYYAIANATADRLTSFVYSLSAAVACEQMSLVATQAMLQFPANPDFSSSGSLSEPQVILTGFQSVASPANFGVPAAYFYGLGGLLPQQMAPLSRYQLATGDLLDHTLTGLSSAIHSGTITDSESFFSVSGKINAAQAARRIAALGIPSGVSIPLAPLDALALSTISDTANGKVLPFASTEHVKMGMAVSGPQIASGTTVGALTPNSVTLSGPILNDIPPGTSIIFTPAYSPGLAAIVKAWLAFPPSITGVPSTDTYQAGEDDTNFWPTTAGANATDFLALVLVAITQGFIIPAPTSAALGDEIISAPGLIVPPPSAANLAVVTAQQWTDLFTQHPDWLPPGNGNAAARIESFLARLQQFFAVAAGGPSAKFTVPTTTPVGAGATVLQFAPTPKIMKGMSVSGDVNIPPGTTVAVVTPAATSTSVTLSQPVSGPIAAGTNITFSVVVSGGVAPLPSALGSLSQDWFTLCLTAYGPFTLGSGFDLSKLSAAAATVFPDDPGAEEWIVDALVTLDALYAVMKSVPLPLPGTPAFEFSIIEALYARGFTSASRITALSGDQFEEALIGTVAYNLAAAIYASATAIAPPLPVTPPSGSFAPVNPDGSLTNCIPPPCTSPLGPIAYLSELLELSASSTCDAPFANSISRATSADTPSGPTLPFASTNGLFEGMSVNGPNIPANSTVTQVGPTSVAISQPVSADVPLASLITFTAPTLDSVLKTRTGPMGDLLASCANLETPLPLIDIVNESLEFMGAQSTPSGGTIYNTSADQLAGHILCQEESCPDHDKGPHCHEPARIFGALPEYSTPATPVSANANVSPAVYNNLKTDFSSCELPYSQALDVSRTYLRHFGSCRFEEMRTFRKCITEFVLDPATDPPSFDSHLWRYPVRIDIAIEYLGITPKEYALLFAGTAASPCSGTADQPPPNPQEPPNPNEPPNQPADPARPPANNQPPGGISPRFPDPNREGPGAGAPGIPAAAGALLGFPSGRTNTGRIDSIAQLPVFLELTCLTYCEFYELWKSGFVEFSNNQEQNGEFPECEPCCLDQILIEFPEEQERQDQTVLLRLVVFIRLWRKLKESGCFCYSFSQLRDICDVLHLFDGTGINPDFIRQFAAFQMLRDQFCLELTDPCDKPAATAIDADRTHLLALWVGPTAAKWGWAVRYLCEKIVRFAERHHGCKHRQPDFVDLLVSKLDPLGRLVGFDPASATDNWHALPTHTLRFAELLAKLTASRFTITEILYLFTVDSPSGCEIFPLPEESEALERPFDLPDDDCEFSLRHLRRELLEAAEIPFSSGAELQISVEAREAGWPHRERHEEGCHEGWRLEAKFSQDSHEEWDWRRVVSVLQEELGFAPADVLDFARHFFPSILEKAGYHVDGASSRFVSALPAAKTTPAMWSVPGEGPFQYDISAGQLWIRLPMSDHAVIGQLTRLSALNADEQNAVQDLYFQPRAMLALFAVLFPNFPEASRHLIEEREICERWDYFRAHVALCHRRCRTIARHLTRHVASVTRQECPEEEAPALLILRRLLGDENKATADWEKDDGREPPVTWTPPPNGAAFAALLGLLGTGLVAEYKTTGGTVAWRDVSGSPGGFGKFRDRENAPVPTVLPALGATISPALAKFVSVSNGFLLKNAGGALLGGAQGFEVTWSGALFIDEEGPYEFWAELLTCDCDKPHSGDTAKWRVTLKRGSRSWVLLSHSWPGEEDRRSASRHLRCGAYDLTVELVRPDPDFASEDQVHALHTGLELQYSGPDSHCERIPIPHRQLFVSTKDQTLGDGIASLSPGAASYLDRYYTSTFRDIRRTYQRAFKALLLAHRFALSARRSCQGTSELGYMLERKERFAGVSYFRSGGAFLRHAAELDFNFLPIVDDYKPPTTDSRTKPSAKRIQAMFDWWERVFDYTVARDDIRRRLDRQLWHLFAEARATTPSDPASLLGQIEPEERFWRLCLRYYQGQAAAIYPVTSADLEDERWGMRVWHADRWLHALVCNFAAKDLTVARPDLWASADPSALVSGETQTGNANLSRFLVDGCIENHEPRRYQELKRLNDALRERGRAALLAYLCNSSRVPLPWLPGQFAKAPSDLSQLLLADVEAGICETRSRVEVLISAIHTFISLARLHREPTWTVTPEFTRMWDREFATFQTWQACKRRYLYKENWSEWSDLEKARGIEAFRLLEDKLRSFTLSVAAPGGGEWWPDERPPSIRQPRLLQSREPSEMQLLSPQREGLNLLGKRERDARPAWVTAVQAGPTPPTAIRGDKKLPMWIEAAIGLGTKFYRVAAAGLPQAGMLFEPHKQPGAEDCVTCCEECGCSHPQLVDEYYFWLIPAQIYGPPPVATLSGTPASSGTGDYQNGYQNDYYDSIQQQSAAWQDVEQLPQLLEWQPQPAVRLSWCRVHNGEFQQVRHSMKALQVTSSTGADLIFLGRTVDSLTFSVSKSITPQGYADPSEPGFRYDLVDDDAAVLPEVLAPAGPPPSFLSSASLPAYPWFLFDSPGESLLPLTPFSSSVAVAKALRSHCRYETALAWYRRAFDPLQQDCTWIECGDDAGQEPGANPDPAGDGNADPGVFTHFSPPAGVSPPRDVPGSSGACCDSTNISCEQARDRSIVLQYVETLVEYSEAVMRKGNSRENCDQSLVILETAAFILGTAPRTVKLSEPSVVPKLSDFVPDFPPLNPRLLALYDVVRDREQNIRACSNAYRLRNGKTPYMEAYFGAPPVLRGDARQASPCCEEDQWCLPRSPYRFTFWIQKAQEYASRAQELGGMLAAAYKEGDAEFLSSMRANQERELLALGFESKKDVFRDTDWQIEALQKTKSVAQASLDYYSFLKHRSLVGGEISYETLTESSTFIRFSANAMEMVSGAMNSTGNFFIGIAGFGGSPLYYQQLPLGQPLAADFASLARMLVSLSDVATTTAGLQLTEAGWQRRAEEWDQQIRTLKIDIQRMERQILGVQRQRDQNLQDLNTLERQFEHSREIQNFLRDKFTAFDLYLFLQKETYALYSKTFDLARQAAHQALRTFTIELGPTARHVIPECKWDDLHEGLTAGEKLSTSLRQLEKAYLDQNIREYELAKQFSLRFHFPLEFLRLWATGCCEIEIPEWMYDLDFPGQYMRRIKNMTITIPCVSGPFTGVHCKVTLLSSSTRIDPALRAPVHECCCPPDPCCHACGEEEKLAREYTACPDDPRILRQYGAREAIVTSTGQKDSGLFQMDLNDSRYLPFEYMGGVCRLRIELPAENNYFPQHSVTDAILSFGLLSREGGPLLRQAALAAARKRLPGDGWRYLDVRHDFPDAWQLFRTCADENRDGRRLKLRLDRKMFPFVPGGREIMIDAIAVLIEGRPGECCDCPTSQGCPCPVHGRRAARCVYFVDHDGECEKNQEIECRIGDNGSDLYCGILPTRIGPIGGKRHHAEIDLRFKDQAECTENVYLLCRYSLPEAPCGVCPE